MGYKQLVYILMGINLVLIVFIIAYIVYFRVKLEKFTTGIVNTLDNILQGKEAFNVLLKDDLFARINHKIIRVYDIINENSKYANKEKMEIQELVSDISHQVKTPISNLKILNDTLINRELCEEERLGFLKNMKGQVNKLDFLIQSMIKISRLETGIITPNMSDSPIYDTIAQSLSIAMVLAEAKNIEISVDCKSDLIVKHDKKWTAEAIFNIIDNAIKYTNIGGIVSISVSKGEMYTKIKIEDNGIGIDKNHYAQIFQRFYREEAVYEMEGVGIGLYLARRIVNLQNGYIEVKSEIGKGSTFSIFLLNR